ncbi:MAG: hypothetical protein ACI8PZ_000684 [Myxococcota bacterium]
MTLVEILQDPAKKAAVVRDGVALIESEVSRKGGMSGLALRAGYGSVKAIKPGIIAHMLGKLMPDFAPAVDPFYAAGRASGDVSRHFRSQSGAIAEALLGVTDSKAKQAENRLMLKVYQRLRGQAKRHVEEAVPGLARLVETHVG